MMCAPDRTVRPTRTRRLRPALLAAAACAAICILLAGICWFACPFPIERLRHLPASPAVLDRHGREFLSLVNRDGQWRRPVPLDRISPRLVQATVAVEDKRFYHHPGVDVLAAVRALGSDCANGRIVSGASTLTMQVARMLDDRPRTWRAKLVEAFRALQLERMEDKSRIVEAYLNMAPYGGNLQGVEAAAQAYFGKHAADVSLGEAALLAGLPQSPARYRPDRHPAAAAARRDTVLRRMEACGYITREQRAIACGEPVELHPRSHAQEALHAAFLALQRRGAGGQTCLDLDVQHEVEALISAYAAELPAELEVAVVVIEIETGDVVALVGSRNFGDRRHGQVNGACARRSPGSALKPFVYAAAFETQRLGPDSFVYDVPITRAGWQPGNFDQTFAGPLPAAEALRRSLNVPAILTAEGVGLSRCLGVMESAGITFSRHTATRGGLATVVGASEVTLLELTNAYATLGRAGIRQRTRLFADEPSEAARVLDANVCAAINDILSCRQRRPHGSEERDLPWFMWKTGTSSRRRDAWAVGHNGQFAIGVWTGYFSGGSDVRLVGCETAEPLLAALFSTALLRADRDPPRPEQWLVRAPLPPPAEVAQPLHIAMPQHGSTYIAVNGRFTLHPRATCRGAAAAGPLNWFLNGRLLPANEADRVSLSCGLYELRCVDETGEAAAVKFCVR